MEDEKYQLLSTIRYDPRLAQVVSADGPQLTKFLKIDPKLALDDQHKGYQCENGPRNKNQFVEFQRDFSQLNDSMLPQDIHPVELSDLDQFQDEVVVTSDISQVFKERFFLLEQHVQRLNVALQVLKCGDMDRIEEDKLFRLLIDAIRAERELGDDVSALLRDDICYKMRVLIDREGKFTCEAHRLPPISGCASFPPTKYFVTVLLSGLATNTGQNNNIWNVFVDTEPIRSNTPFTTFKTTKREHYNKSRERMVKMAEELGLPLIKNEIIVYNDNNQIMEGTITNIAIKRRNSNGEFRWVTPRLSSGCLCGVARYYLLIKNFISQDGNILLNDIHKGDTVLLFNGIMGCVKGFIQ